MIDATTSTLSSISGRPDRCRAGCAALRRRDDRGGRIVSDQSQMTKGVLTYLALLLALSATPAPAAQSTSLSVQINVTAQTTVQTATPPTSITQANMLYQLTSDNPAVSVTVGARNVTIDCQGHALANVFVNADNFTLQNCTTSIVQISGANYSTIRNNTIGMMYYWGGYLGYP